VRLAVSSIAWDAEDEPEILALFGREDVSGVELAPTKWRANPLEATRAEVLGLRNRWRDAGLTIVSLQSLLAGHPDLQLFGDATSRGALHDLLVRTMDFAWQVGAGALVFGSPRNRLRGALSVEEATTIAADFFRTLAPAAAERGCVVCLEANPAVYGGDFLLATAEATGLARRIAHPAIGVNVDLGTMILNGEDPHAEIVAAGALIGHVHVSEPQLAEIGESPLHRVAGDALASIAYPYWVSIEMRAVGPGNNVPAIGRAIRSVERCYYPPHRPGHQR
jgi:sugar phosphate isomerase/epimerase